MSENTPSINDEIEQLREEVVRLRAAGDVAQAEEVGAMLRDAEAVAGREAQANKAAPRGLLSRLSGGKR